MKLQQQPSLGSYNQPVVQKHKKPRIPRLNGHRGYPVYHTTKYVNSISFLTFIVLHSQLLLLCHMRCRILGPDVKVFLIQNNYGNSMNNNNDA